MDCKKISFEDLTDEQQAEGLALTTKRAQEELHAAGLPYVVGDKNGEGCWKIYPDGSKVFIPYGDLKIDFSKFKKRNKLLASKIL
jgi:hypothetical protein